MKKLWDRWGELVRRLLASVGSQASLVALVFVFAPQPVKAEGWPLLLLIVALLLAAVSIWLEIASDAEAHRCRRTFERSDAIGIKSYMRSWIGSSGRAAIWTRDLSWVNDDETKNLLLAKAEGGNLTVCLPKMTAIATMLKDAGAEVCAYGEQEGGSPASRFTIAYLGNGGTQVAIGRTDGRNHVIEELDAGDPALHMATDLVNLARLLSKRGGA